jgi:hypothetical protein
LKGAQMGAFIGLNEQLPPALRMPNGTKPDGTKKDPEPNPDYASWVAKDQTVLNYLLSNMSKEILGHVNTCVTTASAWAAIEGCLRPSHAPRSSAPRWPWLLPPKVHLQLVNILPK